MHAAAEARWPEAHAKRWQFQSNFVLLLSLCPTPRHWRQTGAHLIPDAGAVVTSRDQRWPSALYRAIEHPHITLYADL
eukprot:228955-Pelagomonas_calceolata.AAC.2